MSRFKDKIDHSFLHQSKVSTSEPVIIIEVSINVISMKLDRPSG